MCRLEERSSGIDVATGTKETWQFGLGFDLIFDFGFWPLLGFGFLGFLLFGFFAFGLKGSRIEESL